MPLSCLVGCFVREFLAQVDSFQFLLEQQTTQECLICCLEPTAPDAFIGGTIKG